MKRGEGTLGLINQPQCSNAEFRIQNEELWILNGLNKSVQKLERINRLWQIYQVTAIIYRIQIYRNIMICIPYFDI